MKAAEMLNKKVQTITEQNNILQNIYKRNAKGDWVLTVLEFLPLSFHGPVFAPCQTHLGDALYLMHFCDASYLTHYNDSPCRNR